MKVIRLRRGFSTNCSGTNEFFPGGWSLPPPSLNPDQQQDAGPRIVFRWVLPQVTSRWSGPDAGAVSAPASQPDAGATTAPTSTTTTNGLVIAAVVFGVAVLVGVERLVRALRRRRKGESHDEPAEG
jgi:hypothetical protein